MLKRCHPIARLGWFLPVLLLGMLLCHPVLSPAALGAGLLCQGMALGANSCRTTLGFGLPVILLMGGLNLFFNNRGNTVFLYLNDLPLTLESLLYGLSAGCMAVGMAVWLMLLANSLGRSGLLDLFGGLLPGITMILTMLLRFLPLYRRRMKSRMDTQCTLGRTTQEGSLTRRFQDGGRLLSSQFSASLEQSITTADSMTARGYGLGKRPSRWPMEKFRCRDGGGLAGRWAGLPVFPTGDSGVRLGLLGRHGLLSVAAAVSRSLVGWGKDRQAFCSPPLERQLEGGKCP